MKPFVLLTALCIGAVSYAQPRIHVSVEGNGSGVDWDNTCGLEQALEQAAAVAGMEVWVKQGFYYPEGTLRVPAGTLVYGGFAGGETLLSQRNYAQNTTVLDARKEFGPVVQLGEGAVLDGFAVINGWTVFWPTYRGGGVWMGEDARVENCYILDNQTTEYGGGLYADGNGLVYNTLFSGNSAGSDGLAIWATTLTVRHITASENRHWDDPVAFDSNQCSMNTPAWFILGRAGFATDSTWLIDTLLWSDAVTMNTCDKPYFDAGSDIPPPPTFYADCGPNPDWKGNLFSWCAVTQYGEALCPTPWRVPTAEEVAQLGSNLGGMPPNGLMFRGSTADKGLGYALRCVRTCPLSLNLTSGAGSRTQAMCPGTPITTITHSWNDASADAVLTWETSVPEGITGDAATIAGTPTVPGIYKWTVTVTDNNACPPLVDTGSIAIHPIPETVTVTAIEPTCDSAVLLASNGDDGTIFWQGSIPEGTSTATPATTQTVYASGTYYFRTRSDGGCWGAPGSVEVTIHTAPTITLHPATTARTGVEGTTFPELRVEASGLPPLTYQWHSNTIAETLGSTAIQGATVATYCPSSDNIGTLYYFCVVGNPCGNATSEMSGAHTVEPLVIDAYGCSNVAPGWGESLGTVGFATDTIWVVGNQAWSDGVTATGCDKTDFKGSETTYTNFHADCRSVDYSWQRGHLISWCAVKHFADELCPAPWRVPTLEDFLDLDKALGGTGEIGLQLYSPATPLLFTLWGAEDGGLGATSTGIISGGKYYWSQTDYVSSLAYCLYISAEYRHLNGSSGLKSNGYVLRCVRDAVDAHGCNTGPTGWGESLGTVAFASATERTVSGNGITQIWSDAVMASNCRKESFYGGENIQTSFYSDCRYNPNFPQEPGYPGHYFSWCAVKRFADTLCPAPWRVPTKEDFFDLDKALGGTGNFQSENLSLLARLVGTGANAWGGDYGGYCGRDGEMEGPGTHAEYWAITEHSLERGYGFGYEVAGSISPQGDITKHYGLPLRCVRDGTP